MFRWRNAQVFVNLIDNAVESMKDRGQLTIKVRPGTDWRTGEHGVRITIADTGCGMSLETRKRMYDAFYTTKGHGGSGLGLWVTANIVRKHQGAIHVRSKRLARFGGTVFSLVFPYAGARQNCGLSGTRCLTARHRVCVRTKKKPQISPLRYPGFPVKIGSAGDLHAAFLNQSRIRGRVRCGVAGNPGTLRSR